MRRASSHRASRSPVDEDTTALLLEVPLPAKRARPRAPGRSTDGAQTGYISVKSGGGVGDPPSSRRTGRRPRFEVGRGRGELTLA